ncbi:MAG: family 43 glycosylhydrolase [Clostridia bacterium]|nr:family 43 glycosylhydrolase [Clostridia bacterium]
MKKRTFCNPVNINYRYQRNFFSRESADPLILIYHDKYFLFASHGEGYWISDDLVKWDFIKVDINKYPDFELYAPGTCVVGDRLYITFSQGGNILYSDDPFDPDSWVNIGRPYGWHDPAFLYDDDGYVYVYEGLGDTCLHASKLDPNNNMRLVEGPVPIFYSDYENRGYDRCGDNNEIERMPSLEGAWVNKIDGKYYLTYATPGTEFSTYCDGVAISDSPMGPFENCDNSPTVFKATGFMRGAGHGCLFEDKKGKLWKIDTVSISINTSFERRLCLFPAKIAEDGKLYTNTLRGDYPMYYPHETDDPFTQCDAGLQLLSYGAAYAASSVLDDDHSPACAADENMKTWWSAKSGAAGEWISLDLGGCYKVKAVHVNFADQDIVDTTGRDNGFSYKYTLEVSSDGICWRMLTDRRDNDDDHPHEYFEYENASFRYIKLTNHGQVPAGGRFAVSGIRVFGESVGKAPVKAPDFTPVRDEDARNMRVTWEKVPDAEGYFVRFGVDENELHTHFQIIGGTEVNIRCLIKDVRYHVTVDAYNKGGITRGTVTKIV